MDSSVSIITENNKLSLSGILDFESILSVDLIGKEWLLTLIEKDCWIDLKAITYSNSAGLALLLGWLRTAHKLHLNLQIHCLPDSLKALAKISELDELFAST